METNPSNPSAPFSQGNYLPPAEQQPHFTPPGETDPHFTPPGELEPNFNPDDRIGPASTPSQAELALQPELLPAGDTSLRHGVLLPRKIDKESKSILEKIPGVFTKIEEPETAQATGFVEAVLRAQLQVAGLRQQLNPTGIDSSHKKHPKYISALITQSEQLVGLLTADQNSVRPENIPLSRDGYELLAHRLNKGKIPTVDEVIGLREVITANNPQNLLEDPNLSKVEKAELQRNIKDVQEKSHAEYWLLTDDQITLFTRILKAPSLKPYKPPKAPKPKTKREKLYDGVIAPPGSRRRKIIGEKSTPAPPKPGPDPNSYLISQEIDYVKNELWHKNPRHEYHPHKRINVEDNRAVHGAVGAECAARLKLDSKLKSLKTQV